MFFSSAITILLPYLLFFGVLTTVFYGIAEKLNPSANNKTIYSEDGFHQLSVEHEHTIYFHHYGNEDDSRSTYHQFLAALSQKSIIQCWIFQVNDIFDPPLQKFSVANTVFSLRGPPNFHI